MEALSAEVAPFGIQTMIVNPGFFRTELLTAASTNYANPAVEDYAERRGQQIAFYKAQNGGRPSPSCGLCQSLRQAQAKPSVIMGPLRSSLPPQASVPNPNLEAALERLKQGVFGRRAEAPPAPESACDSRSDRQDEPR
jgi:hypothetical protein